MTPHELAPIRVTLLTQDACRYCEHAKLVLERVSADHRIEVEEIDLTGERGRDLATRHGVLFAPGLLLDGQSFGYGRVSERRLRRELTRREATHLRGIGQVTGSHGD